MFTFVLQLAELSFLLLHASLISLPNSHIYSELRISLKLLNRVSKSVRDGRSRIVDILRIARKYTVDI
jgi:hypothetical protein